MSSIGTKLAACRKVNLETTTEKVIPVAISTVFLDHNDPNNVAGDIGWNSVNFVYGVTLKSRE